ncbi:MAG TPA: LamG-like jellyroll fold domain-containing protein, partial [Verrucomicrobiae bacterium]|nr:LamG-like jellyroll fold domain-containing protein [Verrucomicrobiae bacterium]
MSLLARLWLVICAGILIFSSAAHAQTPILRFSFEDGGLTTTTNTQNGFVLTTFNAAGTATDIHGPPGSGISGQLDNNRSLLMTNASYVASGGVNGPGASTTSSSALAAIPGGTITTFTATEWFKSSVLPPANSLLGRMFILGAGNPADLNAANTIGMKWQNPNQWYVSIANGNPTAQANFSANLPTNTWLFMGIVYDSTNVMIYQGSDTASAKLISTTFAPGLSTSLGGSASLYIGNRSGRQRAYVGWIDEFRFYTNATTANGIEGIREQSAGGGPVAVNYFPDGLSLQQATNKFVFNALSPNGVWGPSVNITNIQLTLNGVDVSSQLVLVTNGTAGTSTNITASYLGLPPNQVNTVVMTLVDANGKIGTSSVTFDNYNPTNFVWEAEEFDFNGGQFIDNADYTSTSGDPNSYYGLDSVATVDTAKITVSGGVNATDYRAGATDNTKTQTPAGTDLPRQRFVNLALADPNVVDHVIANYSSSDWQNYTRTFPAGNYNVYGRLSTASSGTLTFSKVLSGQGTSSQTITNIGTFTVTGISTVNYGWVPLKNSLGNLAVINLGGVSTV